MVARLRCARPSDRLAELRRFYADGVGCRVIAEWEDHEGFDGLVLAHPDLTDWQLEFVRERGRSSPPPPSLEHLLVFYVADRGALQQRADTMDSAGWPRVAPNNPYWARHGVTWADPDGYHVVIAVLPSGNVGSTAAQEPR